MSLKEDLLQRFVTSIGNIKKTMSHFNCGQLDRRADLAVLKISAILRKVNGGFFMFSWARSTGTSIMGKTILKFLHNVHKKVD